MVREMQRVLRRNGKAVIVDFKEENTGSGSPVAIRLYKDQAKLLFEKNGFAFVKSKDPTYHYLIVFRK